MSTILMPYYPVSLLDFLNQSAHMRANYAHARSLKPLTRLQKELIVAYLTIELLWIFEALHLHAKILHCDLKPDNIRLSKRFPTIKSQFDLGCMEKLKNDNVSSDEDGFAEPENPKRPNHRNTSDTSCELLESKTGVLVLSDFGLSLDLKHLPRDAIFRPAIGEKVPRANACIEMMIGKPWKFQVSLHCSFQSVRSTCFIWPVQFMCFCMEII
ncbi:hypothetical protein Ciccas_000568 [Cichlidogyrus casuarinus]|uniref:Protein kinase domain-containing protein n=1 Tax=Cichlidogyrus casuarinus TaxID=1844966 RepID=A0ABD2QMY9_9PLAT